MIDAREMPQPLAMRPIALRELARDHGLELRGPDREISAFNYIDAPRALAGGQLTYAVSASYVELCAERGIAACVTTAELAERGPPEVSCLVSRGDPVEAFFTMFAALAAAGRWEPLEGGVGHETVVARTAVVHDGVRIGDGCRIMDHAVLLPGTRLGNEVVVKPGAVIGGDGFEVRPIGGRRRVVPHVGGVWLGDNVEIGSCTCVDRGLFGEFTVIDRGTKVDNLVHIAHRTLIGPDCSIIAGAEVSGSVVLGEGVWVGPQASINQQISLGDHAFIGTGSVVTKPVPAHGLAFGSPARVRGWVCRCRASLTFTAGSATCPACGSTYALTEDRVTRRSA